MAEATSTRKLAAWGVHAYTAVGLPLALVVVHALYVQDVRLLFLAMIAATVVDATDGAMARAVKVKEVLPSFDGRRLDDIIDFIHFSFLPALALVRLDLLPEGMSWVAAAVVLSSGYGFCQERAKTEDAFVGFPSYWNILVLYLYVLQVPPAVGAGITLFLAVMVFVPIHYVYPTRTRLLRPLTLVAGAVWGVLLVVLALAHQATWAPLLAWLSLAYPVYYTALSLVHHRRVHQRPA